RVEFYRMLLQQANAAHHLVKGWTPAFVLAVGIMQLAGAIDADADQEVVFLEELAPLVIQQGRVGLERVFYGHARFAILRLEFDGFPEKIHAHQGWLTALPGKGYLWYVLRFDML